MAEPPTPITRRPPAPRRPPTPRHGSTATRASSSQQRAIREIARRLIWWQTPDRVLAQPRRFLAQVMALGTWDDIVAVRQVYGDDALRAVLADPPPGVFDPRSWHYWHAVFGIDPVPPLPRRFETQRLTGDDRPATERRQPDDDRTLPPG